MGAADARVRVAEEDKREQRGTCDVMCVVGPERAWDNVGPSPQRHVLSLYSVDIITYYFLLPLEISTWVRIADSQEEQDIYI